MLGGVAQPSWDHEANLRMEITIKLLKQKERACAPDDHGVAIPALDCPLLFLVSGNRGQEKFFLQGIECNEII